MTEPLDESTDATPSPTSVESVIDRVLSRSGTAVSANETGRTDYDGDQFEREQREGLRRVGSLSTELEDVTEVEYRQ